VNANGTNPVGLFKYSEELRNKAVEMFKAGQKAEDIAKELSCSSASVYVWAKNAGVHEPRASPGDGKQKPGPKPGESLSREARNKLILTMFEQGLTPNVIRKQLNIRSAGAVGDVIRRAGLNPYINTPPNRIPKKAEAEQTNLALPLSPAEQMLAARASKAQSVPTSEDVHALRRTIIALRTERDALRRALDEIIGE